jgi:hypothetical protein
MAGRVAIGPHRRRHLLLLTTSRHRRSHFPLAVLGWARRRLPIPRLVRDLTIPTTSDKDRAFGKTIKAENELGLRIVAGFKRFGNGNGSGC